MPSSPSSVRGHSELDRRRRRPQSSASTSTITILPALDATVLQSLPDKNYGHAAELQFSSSTTGDGDGVEFIIKFDLFNLAEEDIRSARLRLHVNSDCGFFDEQNQMHSPPFGDLVAVLAGDETRVVYGEGDTEYEMSVNWNNAPQQPSIGSTSTATAPLEELRGGSWFEMEVTPLVFDSIASATRIDEEDATVTLRIGSTLSPSFESPAMPASTCSFASKDYEDGRRSPQLVLEVGIPETADAVTPMTRTKFATTREGAIACADPYVDGTNYQAGDVVSRKGRYYECKNSPYTVWCGNIAYEPGGPMKSYWTMVWQALEDCEEVSGNIAFKSENHHDAPGVHDEYSNGKENSDYTDGKFSVSKIQPVSASTYTVSGTSSSSSSSSSKNNMSPEVQTSSGSGCAPAYEVRDYIGGDMVEAEGIKYKCKPHPFTSWCGMQAYAPGTAHGQMAWINEGKCEMQVQQETADQGYTIQAHRPQDSSTNDGSFACPPHWQLRYPYAAGDRVTHADSPLVFECRDYPFSESCPDPGSEPIVGPIYASVWRTVGRCVDDRVVEGIVANSGTSLETNLSKRDPPTGRPTRQPTKVSGARPGGLSSSGTVQSAPQACGPAFHADQAHADHDVVSNGDQNFRCLLPRWCAMPKFEPGNGAYWTLVWEELGRCTVPANQPGVKPLVSANERPTKRPSNNKPPNERPNNNERPKPPANTNPPMQPELESPAQPEPCPSPWVLHHEYVAGETVSASGNIFSCRGYPQTGWCGKNSEYEPAVGVHWKLAWINTGNCEGDAAVPFPPPTPNPTHTAKVAVPLPPPTPDPAQVAEIANPVSPSSLENYDVEMTNDPLTAERVFGMLDSKASVIDSTLFLYQGSEPSQVYRYEGFKAGLEIMFENGVAGKHFYLGNGHPENGHLYGLVNIAAFLGQSMKETIQYDACDENSWDYFDMVYPLSNSCGQLGQSYQDYHCPEHEAHMECEVDPNMSIRANTHAKWYGAPGPLFCGPKSEYPQTGIWDYTYNCHNPWAEPPEYCTDYEGQKAGREDNTDPVANRNGRTDVEGCCWWGRGVIQTTGICNFGKLNYYLGKRANDEGRDSRYPDIDFCQDPGIICSSEEHKELKWLAGMFYWIESLQSYNEGGWNYLEQLHNFVDNGMGDHSFINAVSGIVNRGCHNPPCGTGPVDGVHERAGNFNLVLSTIRS